MKTMINTNIKKISLVVTILLLTIGIKAQTTVQFATPGATTWTVPPCVTSITVQVWGGGGGGGGVASRNTSNGGSGSEKEACSAAGGAGGGGFASRTYTVIPGETYNIVVGAGGAGGVGAGAGTTGTNLNNGATGGTSTFSGPSTVGPGTLQAFGGIGGGGARTQNSSSWGHEGHNGTGSLGGGAANGTTMYNGGAGTNGAHSGSCTDRSGAGGGGAGTGAVGGDGVYRACPNPGMFSEMLGGIGGATLGGNGADGRTLANFCTSCTRPYAGDPGLTIGGGGSGALIHLNEWASSWQYQSGGAGARGEVRVIYSSAAIPAAPVVTTPQNFCITGPIPTVADLVPGGPNYIWYTVAVGGVALPTNTPIVTGTYYVAETNGSCEGPRSAVVVNVNYQPTANAGSDATINCGQSVMIGVVPPPPMAAPGCSTAASMTQAGGGYYDDVYTTGGVAGVNINNMNTLVNGIMPNWTISQWYSNYTNHIVQGLPGGSFMLNVAGQHAGGTNPNRVRVWVDWNNDGTFSNPGEIVATTGAGGTNFNFTNIPINIPAAQPLGDVRMRIRSKDNDVFTANDKACDNQWWAPNLGIWLTLSDEIEDYTVRVVSGPGGNGPFTYSWTPATGLDNSTIANPTASPTTTTTYTLTVTSGPGCSSTDQVTVTVNNTTVPTFANPGPICSGAPLNLATTSINGIVGTWSPAVNNTATTTYTFTPNAGQCGVQTTMQVIVNPKVDPTFTNPGPICSGDPLTLPTPSNNGIPGTWSPAVNNTATTNYTFTPSVGQCANTANMTVTVNPKVDPTFTNPGPICSGDPLTLPTPSNNGIPGTWSPAVNNTATTNYTFTPSVGQCANPANMTVTVNSKIDPTFTNPGPICSGDPLTLPTPSNNGIPGTWSPAVNNTATTNYTFTPSVGQCANTANMTVTVNPKVDPTFTNPGPICSGDPLTLPTPSNNGIPGTWSPA
ncbi:MAG: hypothetical protein IT232_11830, partial [Flavobacteriales bacterium]|nr:hypothetical protein [Flavobacteriales bacterium]